MSSSREIKQEHIIDAGEQEFRRVGFANARMERVADNAGVSKGTVYFYFESKENLYMAVTHRALLTLIRRFEEVVRQRADQSGIQTVLGLVEAYLDFSESSHFYAQIMLDYMQSNRNTQAGADTLKLTGALAESIYYKKLQEIQNVPIAIIVEQIKRGKGDGSIKSEQQPELLYLTAWGVAIGFTKLNIAAGTERKTMLGVEISNWRNFQIQMLKGVLLGIE